MRGYDLRRLILATDLLAASLAFTIQIRLALATILGIRMCLLCPHCADTDAPNKVFAWALCLEACGWSESAFVSAWALCPEACEMRHPFDRLGFELRGV